MVPPTMMTMTTIADTVRIGKCDFETGVLIVREVSGVETLVV